MKRILPFALFLLLPLVTAPAHAATFGGEVFGAFNSYAMGDWNDFIDFANASGADADNINGSFTGGLGIRWWAHPSWMLQGTWEPLFATTEDKNSGDEIRATANSFQLGVAHFFPVVGNARYGIGAGLGFYSLNGEITSSSPPDIEVKGSTIGFHFMGHGEWSVSPGFAVTAGAGYRVANIDDTEFDGSSASPKFETDYSGFMGRLGLAFYLPSASR